MESIIVCIADTIQSIVGSKSDVIVLLSSWETDPLYGGGTPGAPWPPPLVVSDQLHTYEYQQ